MTAWYLNAALTQLQRETNLEHPGRDRSSEGTIGDQAHAARTSQHNPDPDGSVDALDSDITNLDLARFRAVVLGDKRTRLLISNRVIYSKRGDGRTLRPYTYLGDNPHDRHAHTEVENGAEHDASPWGYYRGGATVPTVVVPVVAARPTSGGMTRLPTLRRTRGTWKAATVQAQRGVRRLGYDLGRGGLDGLFGPVVEAIVYDLQAKYGLKRDGVIGPKTWCALAQALLARLGFYTGRVDGIFGTGSKAATLAFQQSRGLRQDAIFGPKTWAAAIA